MSETQEHVADLMPYIPAAGEEDETYYKQMKQKRDELLTVMKKEHGQELTSMRNWLQYQPHLPKVSDDLVMRFLYEEDFSVEKTGKLLDNYFSIRTHAPDLFTNFKVRQLIRGPAQVMEVSYLPCDNRTNENYGIIYARLKDTRPEKFNMTEISQFILALIDMCYCQETPGSGVVLVLDMKNVSSSHFAASKFPILEKMLFHLQKVLLSSLKRVHVINTSPIIQQRMLFIKPIMKPQLQNMIHFHEPSEFDGFFKLVPKSLVLSDYGGDLKSMGYYNEKLLKRLEEVGDWIEDRQWLKVEEKKRPGGIKSPRDFFSFDGSFRNLDID